MEVGLKRAFFMKRYFLKLIVIIAFSFGVAQAAIIDTYVEDFDARQDNITINAVDSWSVDQGSTASAITQDSVSYSGDGNSLQLTGAETTVNVSRAATYGGLSPCWIEYVVKPAVGAQARNVPSGKIAAVTFDYTGSIFASDGSSWADTGVDFSEGTWYRVTLKVDFSTHLYDIYIESVDAPDVEFTPDAQNLDFIDTSINSLSQINFGGVYNTSRADDSYIDDIVVHFVDRLNIITASQNLSQEQASNVITVQLQNAYSEAQTAWKDIIIELASSSGQGEFSLDKDDWQSVSQAVIPEDSQSVSFYYKDSTVGKPIITVSEYPDREWTDASQQQKVISRIAGFNVSVTTPHTAGQYFDVEITALDDDGAVNEFYTGEVEILTNYVYPASGTLSVSPSNASGFDEGILNLEMMYPDCGTIEISVRDTQESSKIGYSGEISFIPASFSVTADSPQVVNSTFSITVNAYNDAGEICPNYQGSVSLSPVYVSPSAVSGAQITPVTISADDFTNGTAEVSAVYNRWGTVKIKAHDESYPAIVGESQFLDFIPGDLLVEVQPPAGDRNFFYTGEDIEVVVSLSDANNAPIQNYQGTVAISSTFGLDITESYQFQVQDAGTKSFLVSAESPNSYYIEVEDQVNNLEKRSDKIKVKRATLIVVSTFAPVGSTEVIIRLEDAAGNLIISEDELNVNVSLEEEIDNESASSPALKKPVTFNKGIAKVLISNSQAEIVTIVPEAAYDFKIKKGTVTFGRLAKSGIGALMWREIKD
jgi:hypothetical protein